MCVNQNYGSQKGTTVTTYIDEDEALPEIKISGGASKTLNVLLEAADEYAFLGAAHPDAQDEIEARYNRSVRAIRKLIHRLEANQK